MTYHRSRLFGSVGFGLLVIFSIYGIQTRPILFSDEVINTARTALPTQLAANYFDYSLRPLYRAFNQLATFLFGIEVSSLWLASALSIVAATMALSRLSRPLLGPFARAFIPLMVLTFPLSINVGFGGMPHGTSSIFPAFALVWLVSAVIAFLRDQEARYCEVVLASLFAVLGVLWHPVQIAALGAVVGALFLAILIRVAISDDRVRDLKVGASLIGCALGTIILSILFVELIYRLAVGDARTGRLPEGWSYSYLNLWIGNTGSFDGVLAAYTKPFSFYFFTLIYDYWMVVLPFLLLSAVALAMLVLRLARSRSHLWEIGYFIPVGTVIVWLVVNSMVPMKLVYVIVALLLVVPLATAFLVEYLTKAIKTGPIAETILFAAVVVASAHVGQKQLAARELAGQKLRVVELDYRFVTSLPERAVIMSTVPTPSGARLARYCSYYALAGGKSAERVNDTSELGARLAAAKFPTAVCTSSEAPFRRQLTEAGYSVVYHNKRNNLEIWAKR